MLVAGGEVGGLMLPAVAGTWGLVGLASAFGLALSKVCGCSAGLARLEMAGVFCCLCGLWLHGLRMCNGMALVVPVSRRPRGMAQAWPTRAP